LANKAREANRAVPATFGGSQAGGGGTSSAQVQWSGFFTDPQLRALIDAALKNNQELNILLQEINIAKNEVMARRGEYLPRMGVRAGAGLEKVGRRTSQGAADEATGVPEPLQDYLFGFFASWEVDVWKKLRNATKSAALRYLASIEGRNFMVTRLVAEIANSYYELLALDSALDVVKRNIEIQQNALKVVRLEKEAARVTELAVQRFEAEVFKNQSQQFVIQQKIIETENKINFLVGRFPQPVARNSAGFVDLVPAAVQSGLPAKLLENRPDVRQAELELAAAKLDVKVAKAYFYPSLEISGGVGYQAYGVKHLVTTPGSLFYNIVGDLMAPLINRQGLKANYFSANSKQMQAVYAYEQTILKAFSEAANQVAMIENLAKSYELRSKQVEKLNQSIEISSGLFKSARADYMEVLLTRRDALESQMELIETKQKQLSAVVNLYQALGGGWR